MFFEEKLIELVSQNPHLYDKQNDGYRNFMERSETWKEISAALNCSEGKVTKRWKSLRDRYARELKTDNANRFRYYDSMHFLAGNIRPKSDYAVYVKQDLDEDEDDIESQQPTPKRSRTSPHRTIDDMDDLAEPEIEHQDYSSYETKSTPYVPNKRIKEKTRTDVHDTFLNTIKMFQDTLQNTTKPEDQSFGVHVADMLTTLPPHKKAEAKIHIIQYLSEMQMEAENI